MSSRPENWWTRDLGVWPGVAIGGGLFALAVLSSVESLRLVVVVAALVLMVSAVIDLVMIVNARNTPWGTPDILWLIAIVLLGFVGPIVWLVSGRTHLVADNPAEAEGL